MAEELKEIIEKLDKIYSLLTSRTIATEFSSPQSAKASDSPIKSSRPSVSVSGMETGFIVQHPPFSRFTPEDAAVLLSFCSEKKLSPEEIIFKEGETGNSLFIIKSGEVKIYKKDVLGDVDIARLGMGTIFGEMAIVDNKPRSANVKAVSESHLMEMTRESYYSLIKDAPGVGVKFVDILLNTLAFRLRETDKKIFKLLSRF